ncbi:hypothetical protein TELCIR_12174 [Teladorsagia circumcincta]|uniref:Calcineurin-like phosphoesterase domain-containing protein n=1 Tax=Teladorsagia circumcincta TaxID=45464 RepID=A0A2G9U7G8_TELCI|nr:hypothetical protein TELCIR_12174 [Teladorsagia circumcincta]
MAVNPRPSTTFSATVKYVPLKKLDYIIITGDFQAHDSWDYTEDLTRENIRNVTALLLGYFPKTPVYVSIGNHEGVPQDAMAPHTMPEYEQRGPQWLYSLMKEMWSNWLPQPALADVQYYLYIDQVDPDATLQWLIDELVDSETKGDKVAFCFLVGCAP